MTVCETGVLIHLFTLQSLLHGWLSFLLMCTNNTDWGKGQCNESFSPLNPFKLWFPLEEKKNFSFLVYFSSLLERVHYLVLSISAFWYFKYSSQPMLGVFVLMSGLSWGPWRSGVLPGASPTGSGPGDTTAGATNPGGPRAPAASSPNAAPSLSVWN